MKNLVIEPRACPQSAILTVSKEEFEKVCDAAWEKSGQELIRKYSVKFKKVEGGDQPGAREFLEKNVGANKIYSQNLSDFAVSQLVKETKRNVLFLMSPPRISFTEESDDVNFFFVFYFTPEIKFDFPNEWKLTYVPEFTLETMLTNQDAAMRRHEFSGCLNPSCKFTLEISANGKTDQMDCQSLSEVDYISLRDVLTTHKSGDEFLYKFNYNGEDKEFSVKVSKVFYREDAPTDDVLVKSYGYESLGNMQTKSKETYDNIQGNRKVNQAVDHIINEIVTGGVVEPIPVEFVQHHVKRIKEEHFNKDGKQETLTKFGVDSESKLEELLDNYVVQDFMQSMAFKCYAAYQNLTTTDIEQIAKHMAGGVIWE